MFYAGELKLQKHQGTGIKGEAEIRYKNRKKFGEEDDEFILFCLVLFFCHLAFSPSVTSAAIASSPRACCCQLHSLEHTSDLNLKFNDVSAQRIKSEFLILLFKAGPISVLKLDFQYCPLCLPGCNRILYSALLKLSHNLAFVLASLPLSCSLTYLNPLILRLLLRITSLASTESNFPFL